jgi:hypothetical protein
MPGHACCPKVWLHLAVLCHEQVGPRTVATQSPDSVMQHPERRYVEVERLDDLEAFLAIKGQPSGRLAHLRRPLQSLNRSLHTLERAVAAAGGRVSRTRSQAHAGAVKSH